jgi:hypothetical protein
MTTSTYGAIGKLAQIITVQVKASGLKNAFHLQRLIFTRVRTTTMCRLWCPNRRNFKNIFIGVVSLKIWQFEWGNDPGQ